MVVLTLLVGHVADHYDRRRIVQVCQLVEGLTLAVMAVAIFRRLADHPRRLRRGCWCWAPPGPSSSRPWRRCCRRWCRPWPCPGRVAISSSAVQTATIIGPSLGGLLYAVGVTAPFVVAAVFFLASCALMTFMRLQRTVPRHEPATPALGVLRHRLHPQPAR